MRHLENLSLGGIELKEFKEVLMWQFDEDEDEYGENSQSSSNSSHLEDGLLHNQENQDSMS